MQKQIDEALKDLFKLEERFMSHMAIARVRYVKDKRAFKNYVVGVKVKEIRFNVDKFKLKSSLLGVPGPVYGAIEEYSCKKGKI